MKEEDSNNVPIIFLRREGMAKALSISARSLDDLTKSKLIPCVKLGSKVVLYDPKEVEAAIRSMNGRDFRIQPK
jgi:predicted DNA-binding transcriptional regulator AlpA